VLASFWIRGRWKLLAVAPALLYPIVFVADLYVWLRYAGHNLDPTAALSSAIKPFTPRLLGEGHIGQFSTVASFGAGFYMALLAALLALSATLIAMRARSPQESVADRGATARDTRRSGFRLRSRIAERHDHASAI
jgi:copper chaperone NosL